MIFALPQYNYKLNYLSFHGFLTYHLLPQPASENNPFSSPRSISFLIMLIRCSLQSRLWIRFVCRWLAQLWVEYGIQFCKARDTSERLQSRRPPSFPSPLPPLKSCPCTCPEIRKSYWCLKYGWPISAKGDIYDFLSTLMHANDGPFDKRREERKKKSIRLSVHLTAELWDCSWFARESLGYLMMFGNVFT